MARESKMNYQEKVARHMAARAEQIAEEIAGKWGDPTNSRKIDPATELQMWQKRQMFHPETGEPLDAHAILKQKMDEGLDGESALAATVDMVFPMRRRLMVTQAGPNPDDRVKYVERMNKRMTQAQGGAEMEDIEDSAPAVEPPPQEMY
jgi:hypothetical protein